MIGYVTLGSNDLDKARAFYDALLSELGASRLMDNERMTIYAVDPTRPMLAVCRPFDGGAATVGNGTMVALAVGSRENVDRVHARALSLGAADEGAPGERMPTFYGGYFRDLDGNKFVAFHMG
jgi:predicted lactoylglutathione lyase